MARVTRLGIILALLAATVLGHADTVPTRSVWGWVELVRIEPMDAKVKAKLDSGALTSSMHARQIETFRREGKTWVRFSVDVQDHDSGELIEHTFEQPRYRQVRIRGAGGESRRPVVLMTFCIGDTRYEEQVTLRDRSNMNYPVLLGRRTLQHLGALDVTQTFTQRPSCDDDALVLLQDEIEDEETIEDDQRL